MDNQKLSERLSAPPDCAECNGKGYAELIDGWERPCDACRGEGFVMDKAEQPTITQALKPCPFCGSSKIYVDRYVRDGSGISCGDCNTKIWEYHGPPDRPSAKDRCLARWNTRTSLAAQDGLVEAVAEALLSAFLAGRGSVTADGRKAYKPTPSMADFRNIALSAIKEQHND